MKARSRLTSKAVATIEQQVGHAVAGIRDRVFVATKVSPEHFRFGLKAPQKVTHIAKLRDCAELLDIFQRVVSRLGSKLGPVLFQLPPSFKKDATLLNEFLGSLPTGIRAAFEFRHSSWFDDEIFGQLQKHSAALCIAESSDLVTPSLATTDFGYLRLRREDYEKADIARWAKFIEAQKDRWSHAFVYFKHEEKGVGPKFAKQLIGLTANKFRPS